MDTKDANGADETRRAERRQRDAELGGILKVAQLALDFGAGGTAAEDAGGRFDFLGGKPMRHVGVAAFAALTTRNFFLSGCAHK